MVRVNDVDMAEQRINGNVELRVTDVDVGLTGAARRLLQGPGVAGVIRSIQEEIADAGDPLGVRQPDRARPVAARETTHHPPETGTDASGGLGGHHGGTLAQRTASDYRFAGRTIRRRCAVGARFAAHVADCRKAWNQGRAADIIEEMEPDKAADVLAGLSPEMSCARRARGNAPARTRATCKPLTAIRRGARPGGMMTSDFIFVGGDVGRAAKSLEFIRGREVKLEQLDTIFLINAEAQLSGAVAIARLLLGARRSAGGGTEVGAAPVEAAAEEAHEKEVFRAIRQIQLARKSGRGGWRRTPDQEVDYGG